jgi:chromosome segregation ATPase
MATFHELQNRRQDLLNDLDELEEAAAELTTALTAPDPDDEETLDKQRQHLAWLDRQRAGLLVVLSETERALLAFDADGEDPR